jgi:RND family efflux transporter MFP subunit
MRRRFAAMFVPCLLLVGSGLAAWHIMSTRPQPMSGQVRPASPLVMAEAVREGGAPLVIRALGTVRPIYEVQLRPRVTGTVIELNPALQPGDRVRAGETLVRLDPLDYELEVRRQESVIARAKADLDLEMGQQKVARAELDQLRRTLPGLSGMSVAIEDSALARREPQLARAGAALAEAEANLAEARANLERTVIVAPFNALVLSRNVGPGSQAGTGDVLATLVSTDAYWVEAVVPLDRLRAIREKAGDGLPVEVSVSGGQRKGLVDKVTGVLDADARMGQTLIRVDDPLCLLAGDPSAVPLLLNDQVQVAVHLGVRPGVIVLPRSALRGMNTVWTAADGRLDIRRVEVLWRDADHVYISSGLRPGEVIVTSDLAAPIQGMSIRLSGADR